MQLYLQVFLLALQLAHSWVLQAGQRAGLPTAAVCLRSATYCSAEPITDVEYVRQQLAAKEAAYQAARREAAKAELQGKGDMDDVPALDSLPRLAYIDEQGLVVDAAEPGARASVYAISNEEDVVQYVGVTRDLQQSLKGHLARCPGQCYWVRVKQFSKPSRTLLEAIRERWLSELPDAAPGNDEGENQAVWEEALDVRPFMTDKEKAGLEAAKEKELAGVRSAVASALKVTCRRLEAEKLEVLSRRGIKEELRFDPKMKGRGLLDLAPPKNKKK